MNMLTENGKAIDLGLVDDATVEPPPLGGHYTAVTAICWRPETSFSNMPLLGPHCSHHRHRRKDLGGSQDGTDEILHTDTDNDNQRSKLAHIDTHGHAVDAPTQPLSIVAPSPALRSPPTPVGPADCHRVDTMAAAPTSGMATGRGHGSAAAADPSPRVLTTAARGHLRRRRSPWRRYGRPAAGKVCPPSAPVAAVAAAAVVVVVLLLLPPPPPIAGWVHRTPRAAVARRSVMTAAGSLCQRRPLGRGALPHPTGVPAPASSRR